MRILAPGFRYNHKRKNKKFWRCNSLILPFTLITYFNFCNKMTQPMKEKSFLPNVHSDLWEKIAAYKCFFFCISYCSLPLWSFLVFYNNLKISIQNVQLYFDQIINISIKKFSRLSKKLTKYSYWGRFFIQPICVFREQFIKTVYILPTDY